MFDLFKTYFPHPFCTERPLTSCHYCVHIRICKLQSSLQTLNVCHIEVLLIVVANHVFILMVLVLMP